MRFYAASQPGECYSLKDCPVSWFGREQAEVQRGEGTGPRSQSDPGLEDGEPGLAPGLGVLGLHLKHPDRCFRGKIWWEVGQSQRRGGWAQVVLGGGGLKHNRICCLLGQGWPFTGASGRVEMRQYKVGAISERISNGGTWTGSVGWTQEGRRCLLLLLFSRHPTLSAGRC